MSFCKEGITWPQSGSDSLRKKIYNSRHRDLATTRLNSDPTTIATVAFDSSA